MIIDAFPFFNEKELLRLRLEELDKFVDYHIIVESNVTQSLIPKPFNFLEWQYEFSEFLDKIIYVMLEEYPDEPGSWAMENFQRSQIRRGTDRLNLNKDDIICISDCDEIPDFRRLDVSQGLQAVNMSYHVFYADLLAEKDWIGTVIAPYEDYCKFGPQGLRNIKDNLRTTEERAGWHLGYLGGKQRIWNKWHSCIEPLDKSKIPSFDEFSAEFDRKIKDGGSFLFSDKQDDSVILKQCKKEYPTLPNYLVKHQVDFKSLFLT